MPKGQRIDDPHRTANPFRVLRLKGVVPRRLPELHNGFGIPPGPYTSLLVPRSTVTVSNSDRVCPSTATNFAVSCVLVTLTNRYP